MIEIYLKEIFMNYLFIISFCYISGNLIPYQESGAPSGDLFSNTIQVLNDLNILLASFLIINSIIYNLQKGNYFIITIICIFTFYLGSYWYYYSLPAAAIY